MESEFETNLLKHILSLLESATLSPESRYASSLLLSTIPSKMIENFLPNFVTKMTHSEFLAEVGESFLNRDETLKSISAFHSGILQQ